jgi:hypothetical protein
MTQFEIYQIARLLVRVLAVAFVPTTGVLLALWLAARGRAGAAERLLQSRAFSGGPDRDVRDERLERLERAVDVVAIEIERVAEGQRFASKLLAERLAGRDVSEPRGQSTSARVVTPH